MLYPESAPVLINSTVAAARARVRGPTLSEQRAEQQRKELEAIDAAAALLRLLRLLRPFGIITCHQERLPVTGVGRPGIVKL